MKDSHSLRLDAEYFHPDYLESLDLLEAAGSRKLSDFGVMIRHPKEIRRNYVVNGVQMLRGQNVRPLSIDMAANPVYISEEDAAILSGNAIRRKDILITRSGANTGQCAIFLENKRAISMSDTLIIRSGNLNPFYLAVFLNSKYGEALVRRGIYGSAQPHIAPPLLYRMLIPNWERLACETEKTYMQSRAMKERSRERYAEAEALLLSELGLADWRPKRALAFVKNYSDIRRAERIDADYFQPKYDEIVDAVKAYPGGWDALGNLAHIKPSNFKPAAETEYRYIELANIGRNGEIIAHTRDYGHNLPTRARCKVAAGDVIASSIEGSLDSVALIPEEYDNALCSTGFYAVSSSAINSETLLTLLKSSIGQMQLKKGCSGTILTAINSDEFKKLALPLILPDKQREIERKVAESFNLRSRSKELLEYAKRAVEIAIEQDENAAIDWLRQKTEGVGA